MGREKSAYSFASLAIQPLRAPAQRRSQWRVVEKSAHTFRLDQRQRLPPLTNKEPSSLGVHGCVIVRRLTKHRRSHGQKQDDGQHGEGSLRLI
jgi:hypothetical protein